MKTVGTLEPKGNSRSTKRELIRGADLLGMGRMRWNDGGDPPEPTPLPEGFNGGEGFEDIKTVEALSDAYKAQRSKTYLDFMGDGAKDDPNINRYKTGEEFRKGFNSMSELVGKKGVIIPDENSDDETRRKYRESMGIPESADGYSTPDVEGLHKEIELTPEVAAGLKAMAYKHGLSDTQAKGIFSDYLSSISNSLTRRDEQNNLMKGEAEAALHSEWGKDYNENATIARRLVEKFGGKEALESFGNLGNNPGVLKFLANLGKTISEDSFVGVGAMDLSTDATGAKNRIKQIEADEDFMRPESPRHNALVKERTKLFEIAYAE